VTKEKLLLLKNQILEDEEKLLFKLKKEVDQKTEQNIGQS